jgi:hypothetical protein
MQIQRVLPNASTHVKDPTLLAKQHIFIVVTERHLIDLQGL